jgi:hypothetical protein
MLKSLIRVGAGLLAAASLGFSVLPASADNSAALAGMVSGANTAIRNAMDARPKARQESKTAGTVAQVPPIQQQPVSGQAGLPTGLTYFVDGSVAYPIGGDIGTYGKKWLPGGMDAMAAWGFNPQERFVASYYELQHYPVGFNSGQVPLYLPPGFPSTSRGCVDLSGKGTATCPGIASPIDVTTKDRFLLLSFEQLIPIGTMKGRPIPIVVTPTFVSRWSAVAASNGNGDVVAFVSPINGQPLTDVHTRTAQYDSLAITLPFLKTPKMFGTFTAAPTVLTHLNGVNQENAIQWYQILYVEYNITNTTRLFFEPQSSRDYLPPDVYAQHLAAYFVGVTQHFAKYGFVQLVLNSGGPTNYSPYGVKYLQCYSLPCSSHSVPAVGGLKATQLQLQFGIGSPVILPF